MPKIEKEIKTPEEYLASLRKDAEDAEKTARDALLEEDPEKEEIKQTLQQDLSLPAARLIVLNNRDRSAEFDAGDLDDLATEPILSNALGDSSIKDLRKAIQSGDTSKLEADMKRFFAKQPTLSDKLPQYLAPNARDYTENLQKRMKGHKFLEEDVTEQIDMYKQLLSTRASVRAVRNTFRGRTLDKPVDLEAYRANLYDMGNQDPIDTALSNLIKNNDEKTVRDWAINGHGGLLEDKVKLELRAMAKTEPYKLGHPIPEHFRPTVKERLQDIKDILADGTKWNAMDEMEKKKLISEYALLSKNAKTPEAMNSVLGDIQEHNTAVEQMAQGKSFDKYNLDVLRGNLANADLDKVVEGFNKEQQQKKEIETLQNQKEERERQEMADRLEEEFNKNYGGNKSKEKKEEQKSGPQAGSGPIA